MTTPAETAVEARPVAEVEPVEDAPPPRYMRRGKCDTGIPRCGKEARFYAAGWRCEEHRPRSM